MSRHHNKTVVVEMTPDEVARLDLVRMASGRPQAEILRLALVEVSNRDRDWWDAQPRTRIPGGRR